MWKDVGKQWKKTGNQMMAVLKNPSFQFFAIIAGGCLASGGLAPLAMIPVCYWIFFGRFTDK